MFILFQGGIYALELLNDFCGGLPNVVIGLFMCLGLMWIYKVRHFCADVELMIGRPVSVYWKAMWCVISPVIMVVGSKQILSHTTSLYVGNQTF